MFYTLRRSSEDFVWGVSRRGLCSRGEVYFAGMRRSSITLAAELPMLPSRAFFVFFDWTFTTIRAGFRRPALTSSESASASVIVALNSPVLRCFGRCLRIRVKVCWNPRSSNLGCKVVDGKDTSSGKISHTCPLHLVPELLSPLHLRHPSLCREEIPPPGLGYRSRCPLWS